MNTTIIVGGGIAGCTLTYSLLQRGHNVIHINNSNLPSASAVAAGLYNPIVFKRLVPTWLANDVVPYCKEFYKHIEQLTHTQFHYEIPILKLLTEQQEVDLWQKKQQNTETTRWLGSVATGNIHRIHNKHAGKGIVNESGWVNVPILLQAYTTYFASQHNYSSINAQFDYNKISVTPQTITYMGVQAQRIVFAEGVYVSNNPFFKHILMKPTKGDVFKIEASLDKDYVLNKGCFLIPFAPQKFLVGATYNWQDSTWEATPEGKAALLTKVNDLVQTPFVITEHTVGVRPTTHDRRPTLGAHHTHKNMFVFNGLGTKGVLLAPYLANHLAHYMHNETELMPEANVSRYNTL